MAKNKKKRPVADSPTPDYEHREEAETAKPSEGAPQYLSCVTCGNKPIYRLTPTQDLVPSAMTVFNDELLGYEAVNTHQLSHIMAELSAISDLLTRLVAIAETPPDMV